MFQLLGKSTFENQKKETSSTKVTDINEENHASEEQFDQNTGIQHSKSETDRTQVAIGISVGIATTSLLVLIVVTIYTLHQRRKIDNFNYRRKLASQNCSSTNSQFTLVPTSQGRNTMRSSLEQERTMRGSLEQERTMRGSLEQERTMSSTSEQNNAQRFSMHAFEIHEPAEFDFYYCTNNRATLDKYYGNDGIIVHVWLAFFFWVRKWNLQCFSI